MTRIEKLTGILLVSIMLAPAGCGDDGVAPLADGEYQLVILPQDASIVTGQSLQLSVMLIDEDGSLLPHPAAQNVAWESSDAEIAKVSSDGVVFALSEGEVNVTAGCRGQCAWATVNVGG